MQRLNKLIGGRSDIHIRSSIMMNINSFNNSRKFSSTIKASSSEKETTIKKYGGMMGKNWDELWQNNQTPWDTKQGCPILRHLVENVYNNRSDLKHGLIPGCGNGYDADLMSGIQSIETVTGLDISETAVESANGVCSEFVDLF